MNTIIHPVNDHELALEITVPWDHVQSDYNDLLKRYSKVPIKGFRPGNVPVKIVEKTFRQEIKNDFASACATRIVRKALEEQNLEAGSPVELSEIDLVPESHFSFKAQFLKMPEFDLPDYAHFDLKSLSDEEKRDKISEELLAKTTMQLHPQMVEKELQHSDNDEIQAQPEAEREAAEQRVKLLLILKKIARQDGIEIDDNDVEERIRKLAVENEVSPNEMKEYLLSNGGLSRLRDYLLAEQVLDYIIDL